MVRAGSIVGCLCAVVSMIDIDAGHSVARADTKYNFDIYGFAEADFIYDADRVDPAWEDTLRPSKIPTTEGLFGSNGQTLFSVKQSRLGVSGDIPIDKNSSDDITFKFEFDMFGVGVDAGQTTIRLRHAFGEWGPLLAGQTNSLFMDIENFPNVIDYWGPNGMVFLRTPQFRYTPYRTDHSHFSVAIEKPGNDIDAGLIRQLDPNLGANIENDEKMPDLTAQYFTSGSWGHFQLAGILRRVGYDTLGTTDNRPKGAQLGWGINAGGHIALFQKDRLILEVNHGDGIASYQNDGGVDLAPELQGGALHAKAVPLTGFEAYYDRYWDDHFSTALGYSFVQVDNTNFQEASAFHKADYASINLLWTPASRILIVGELLWGKREDNDGATGRDVRFQFSIKYTFGTSITI